MKYDYLKFCKLQALLIAVVFIISTYLLVSIIPLHAALEQDESGIVLRPYVNMANVLIIDIKESLFGNIGSIQNQAAVISSLPASNTVNVGDTFTVNIFLDTELANTDGVDIKYLNFDPLLLEVQQILPGTLYPSTQSNVFDNIAGTVNFSQVTTGGSTYSSSGTLATITFLAKAAGTATLTFDFVLNRTTDTNVASAGADVLTGVTGASYTLNPVGGDIDPPSIPAGLTAIAASQTAMTSHGRPPLTMSVLLTT